MRTTALVPAIIALALLCACEDERSSGVILTSDGHVLNNSAENNRQLAVSRIDDSLAKRIGVHWRARTTIAQLPQWDDGRDSEPEWRWDRCDVAIEIVGDGKATLPIAPDEVRTGVYDYMRSKVDRPGRNLKVSVAVEDDPGRFAALGAAPQPPGAPITYATAPPPPPTGSAMAAPAGSPPPSYFIQAGDTWAALSTAFYGSPALWRTLAEANHWNGGNPRVGEALVVPPPPGAEPPPAGRAPSAVPTAPPAPAEPPSPSASTAPEQPAPAAPAPAPAPASLPEPAPRH